MLRAALLAALVCCAVPADAQSQVAVLIGTTPGGGYDLYARALARHIGRHLPGQPTVIPKNLPGAGGLTLANYMYNRAPVDGSEIAIVQNGLPFEKLSRRCRRKAATRCSTRQSSAGSAASARACS
jgi:tripartite-type tricarboxylate transporter receptor subunit TctC